MSSALGTIPYIDTHAHLDDSQFDGDRDAVISRANDAGAARIINIGYHPDRWVKSVELAARHECIAYSLGVHPHVAELWSAEVEKKLESAIEQWSPVAIGETGLDYFRNRSAPAAQRSALRGQMAIAARARLPVVIHLRGDAEADLILELEREPDVVLILHSFDGTPRLRDYGLARGSHFGAGGLMTKPDASRLRDTLRGVPLDRVVLETDSPYLSPAGWPSRRNSPESVPIVAQAVAELHGLDAETVRHVTTATACQVFGLTVRGLSDPLAATGVTG